jgi:hypothetical protein
MKKTLFIVATISIAFCACKKEHDHDAYPEIKFIEPVDDQTYSLTDTVRIRATITHNEEMHTCLLIAENIEDNIKDTLINKHDHSKIINIDKKYFPNVTAHRHFRIRIKATDHNNKTSDKHVTIHVE